MVIAGAYFLIFHRGPLPLNHESVGLGTFHALHDVIGVILLGLAGFIWWRSRRSTRTARMRGTT
ncbi:MAG: hypothetical protein E6K03_03825 [Methanobacteriota archaeon]|nr:MAG: hypothetical protein E6K03_03825 [Euryarchaeota archaeon]